jgi:hypothetical protein
MMGDPETAATQQPPEDQAQPTATPEESDTTEATGTTGESGTPEETGGIQPETAGPIYKP